MSNIRTSLPIPTHPWEAAKASFLEDLSSEQRALFQNATLENVFYHASVAQKQCAQSRSWLLQERLSSLVDAIDDYAKALDVLSNSYSLLCCPIWGGIRVILHIAAEAGKFQDSIVDMLAQIGDVLPRFGIYQALFRDHERLAIALSSVYLDILHFCTATKDFFTRASRSMIPLSIVLKGAWKTQRQNFDTSMKSFRAHSKRVEKEARTAHMIESARARELQLANRALQIKNEKIRKRHSVLTALPAVDYVAKHLHALGLRHPGTNAWVRSTPEYTSWMSNPASDCLSCFGIPGSGKTVLCASVVNDLQDKLQQCLPQGQFETKPSILCYYYCDFSDSKSLEPSVILGSIAKQSIESMGLDYFDDNFVCPLEQNKLAGGTQTVLQYLKSLFKQFETVYLTFDAIDQLTTSGQSFLLDMIHDLIQDASIMVKVFVTSRSEEYLVRTSLHSFQKMFLSSSELQSDIETFVRARIEAISKTQNPLLQEESMKRDVIKALCSGAKDMFLWVEFQLYEISDAVTEDAIHSAISNLPKSLAETYSRIFDKIYYAVHKDDQRCMVLWVFAWLRGARRPLNLDELEEAVGLQPDDTYLHAERTARDMGQRLVSSCGNLVVHHLEDNTVTFAHHTVQQFLDSLIKQKENPHPWRFSLMRDEIERFIAEVCVAYLSFTDFETQVAKITRPLELEKPTAENIVWNNVPFASPIRSFLKWTTLAGTDSSTEARRPLKFQAPVTTRPSNTLAKRYTMLDYVITYWAFHVGPITSTDSTWWPKTKHLVWYKDLAFNFRPWMELDHYTWTKQALLTTAKSLSCGIESHDSDTEELFKKPLLGDLLLYSWSMRQGIGCFLTFMHVDSLKPYALMLEKWNFWHFHNAIHNPSQSASKNQDRYDVWITTMRFNARVLRHTVSFGSFWSGSFFYSISDDEAILDTALKEYSIWAKSCNPALTDPVSDGAMLAIQHWRTSGTSLLLKRLDLTTMRWERCYQVLCAMIREGCRSTEVFLSLIQAPNFQTRTTWEQGQMLFAVSKVLDQIQGLVSDSTVCVVDWGPMIDVVVPLAIVHSRTYLLERLGAHIRAPSTVVSCQTTLFRYPAADWTKFDFGDQEVYHRLRRLDGKCTVQQAQNLISLRQEFQIPSIDPAFVLLRLEACEDFFSADQFEKDKIHCLYFALILRFTSLVTKLAPYYMDFLASPKNSRAIRQKLADHFRSDSESHGLREILITAQATDLDRADFTFRSLLIPLLPSELLVRLHHLLLQRKHATVSNNMALLNGLGGLDSRIEQSSFSYIAGLLNEYEKQIWTKSIETIFSEWIDSQMI